MKMLTIIAVGLLGTTACLSTVSTKTVKREGLKNEKKGHEILTEAWETQGMNLLHTHQTYHVKGHDQWKGMLGKIGKVWPENESNIELKYAVGSFDGQVTFLDGKREGLVAGLQSWQYYEQEKGKELEFKKKQNARITFGISAYQYFFELLDRLKQAPIVVYGGEKEFKGNSYDLVFVTWEKLKTHKEHDQYCLWINKKTKVLDYAEYTLHDTYLPGGSMIPGAIEFADYKKVDGILIPFTQYIYAAGVKKKQEKYLHKLSVSSFEFDSFNDSLLYPNKTIEKIGDSKL